MLSSMRNYRKCLVLIVLFVLCSCLAKASQPIKPVTVCEVLEDLPRYSGKTIAVLGRLASNLIDGAWLTETGCSSVEPSTPIWPHAVFLGCNDDIKPKPLPNKLRLDEHALKAKIERLRKSTVLGYHDKMVMSPDRKTVVLQERDTWSVVYGRIKSAPEGQNGWFGVVRAKAQLCAADGARVDIPEPQPPHQ